MKTGRERQGAVVAETVWPLMGIAPGVDVLASRRDIGALALRPRTRFQKFIALPHYLSRERLYGQSKDIERRRRLSRQDTLRAKSASNRPPMLSSSCNPMQMSMDCQIGRDAKFGKESTLRPTVAPATFTTEAAANSLVGRIPGTPFASSPRSRPRVRLPSREHSKQYLLPIHTLREAARHALNILHRRSTSQSNWPRAAPRLLTHILRLPGHRAARVPIRCVALDCGALLIRIASITPNCGLAPVSGLRCVREYLGGPGDCYRAIRRKDYPNSRMHWAASCGYRRRLGLAQSAVDAVNNCVKWTRQVAHDAAPESVAAEAVYQIDCWHKRRAVGLRCRSKVSRRIEAL